MSSDLAPIPREHVEKHAASDVAGHNRISDKIRRNGAIAVKELLRADDLPDVLHREPRRSILAPVILFTIDGYKESDGHV